MAFMQRFGAREIFEKIWERLCELRLVNVFEYGEYELQFMDLWDKWVATLAIGERTPDFLKRDRFVAGLCPHLKDKIKYGDTLRRISVPYEDLDDFSYDDMEQKMREFFEISTTFRLLFTYKDRDNDVVTMADSQDIKDACLEQKSTAKAIDQVLSRYPPCLFTTVPAHVLPDALDTFLGTLAGNSENATKLQRGDQVVRYGRAVHKYIECDNCCMCPVVGPRYKSIKKHDFDLCSNCFEKVGSAAEYYKLDCPSIAVPPNLDAFIKGAPDRSSRGPSDWVSSKSNTPLEDLKGEYRLLDAEFVKDVTILDGSKVDVGSTFTKVWRLRNSGALPWPQDTKLVHVGGIMLGSIGFATLKLPEGGLPFKSELDVSVELKAPERTGQYVASWRLRAPSGQMFGHSVWVLIEAVPVCNKSQTDKELKDYLSEEAKTGGSFVIRGIEVEEGNNAELGLGEVGLKTPSISQNSKEPCEETDGFSLVESANNGIGKEGEAPEEFELVGLLSQEFTFEELSVKQSDANIVSHKNSFAEDDSLASTGWDHMLKELEELGFHESQTIMKDLLLKSEGSVKRAVKELVELEKQTSRKIKAA
ncbi:hypothetical protein L7F22_051136 [Adiantum nelumboides]|nr:hypothetical protein [Adiantum nelumboides]